MSTFAPKTTFTGPKVIYAAANRMGARAARESIVFKQTPYALEVTGLGEGLDKSIPDLPAHAESGACPDSASTNQALACLIRGPAIHGRRKL
jgi:hypothetical protein